MTGNLYHLIAATVQRNPSAVAIQTDSGEVFNYAEFDRWTACYSAFLAARNVRRGDRVLLQADKSAHLLLLTYACIRAGIIAVPINVGSRNLEVATLVSDSEPTLVICDPRRKAIYDSLSKHSRTNFQLSTLAANGRGEAREWAENLPAASPLADVSDGATAALMYTSGTTGKPKAAIVTHRNIRANGLALRDFWKWTAEEVVLHPLPLYHLHGLFVATMPSLLTGSKILLQRRFTVPSAISGIPQATIFMGVPTYFARLLSSPALTREHCAQIRLFISGSAPMQERVLFTFRERTGHTILVRYGLTETGGAACTPVGEPRTQGAVGIPLANISIRIADEIGTEMPTGQAGEIQARGDSVFPGYWRRPEDTRDAFTADGHFRTGDLGKQHPDGSFDVIGRAKEVIITGGINVNPQEVEDALDACPGVAESAVFGVPHPDYGETIVAAIVREKDHLHMDSNQFINEIRTSLKRSLAIYKVPRKFVLRGELPRNDMGKILKHRLRAEPM